MISGEGASSETDIFKTCYVKNNYEPREPYFWHIT